MGLLLPNTPHFIVAYNAAHLLGAVVVALNPLMPAPEIGRELEETGCKVLVALDRLLDRLPEETPGTVLVAEAAHYAPAHLSALSRLRQRGARRPRGALRFEDLITGPGLADEAEIDAREDAAVIMFTSGTTGWWPTPSSRTTGSGAGATAPSLRRRGGPSSCAPCRSSTATGLWS